MSLQGLNVTKYAVSVTRASPGNSKHRLSCNDRYWAKMAESSDFYTVNNIIIRTYHCPSMLPARVHTTVLEKIPRYKIFYDTQP